ncbi:SPT7_4 [Sanghuangporus weigelae]
MTRRVVALSSFFYPPPPQQPATATECSRQRPEASSLDCKGRKLCSLWLISYPYFDAQRALWSRLNVFYDSLEGVLLELRTVTIDNHNAETFFKPVPKTDYPDYYEIIKEPMDLQTMLRKVKQKQYKSKAEFQDDLDLICAKRLQQKANRLLKNITDRLDPPVPFPIDAVHPRMPNGVMVNGHSGHSHKRSDATTPVPKMPIVIKKSAPPSRTMSIAPPSPPPPGTI